MSLSWSYSLLTWLVCCLSRLPMEDHSFSARIRILRRIPRSMTKDLTCAVGQYWTLSWHDFRLCCLCSRRLRPCHYSKGIWCISSIRSYRGHLNRCRQQRLWHIVWLYQFGNLEAHHQASLQWCRGSRSPKKECSQSRTRYSGRQGSHKDIHRTWSTSPKQQRPLILTNFLLIII